MHTVMRLVITRPGQFWLGYPVVVKHDHQTPRHTAGRASSGTHTKNDVYSSLRRRNYSTLADLVLLTGFTAVLPPRTASACLRSKGAAVTTPLAFTSQYWGTVVTP